MTSHSLTMDDGSHIDYEVAGSGETLVLLHSGMMSREDMRAQITYFSKHYKVVAIDSRDHGRSGPTERAISYELMAGDVIEILNFLQIPSAYFFGQSDGGITGLVIAHLNPTRIIKMAIHGAVYHFDAYPEEVRSFWKSVTFEASDSAATDPRGFPGMAIKHYLMGRNSLDQFEAHLQKLSSMWATSPTLGESDLNAIEVPMLVIVGDRFDISLAHTLTMYEALGNSQLFVVPGASHFVHDEKPDLLHQVVRSFLQE